MASNALADRWRMLVHAQRRLLDRQRAAKDGRPGDAIDFAPPTVEKPEDVRVLLDRVENQIKAIVEIFSEENRNDD